MEVPYMTDLLTTNAKLVKGSSLGWLGTGLSLLPGNKSGTEFCHNRGKCFATCLDTAGHGNLPNVRAARMWRSRLFVDEPADFFQLLTGELLQHRERAKRRGFKPAVRLNVLSDIPWELLAPVLFERFKDIQFYDYTKSIERASLSLRGAWPRNYILTYSWNEKADARQTHTLLRRGGRVAAVSRDNGHDLPFWMKPQVDGDKHDFIFLHPPGAVQVLTPKGKLKHKETAFA
jgi:hypothetical protein